MALVTTNSGPYVLALGPIKAEVAQISSVDSGDTYNSRIQRPVFGFFAETADTDGPMNSVNLFITGKIIAFNNEGLSNSSGTLILFGF
jgi:hypothetical protein